MGRSTTFPPLFRKQGFVYKAFRFKMVIPIVYGIFSTHATFPSTEPPVVGGIL